MKDVELKKILKEQFHYEYLQLPESLSQRLHMENKSDYKGVVARYQLIKAYVKENPINNLIDIGGNCGYFSLSLLDEGLIEKATIYDVNPEVLDLGRKIAESMNLSSKCDFIKKNINIDELESLPNADAVIYQNVLHHAGDYFDEELVAESGWESYARSFLEKLRNKYQFGIVGMGFKWNKPKYWDVDKKDRKQIFDDLLKGADWEIVSDVNVFKLVNYDNIIQYEEFKSQNNNQAYIKNNFSSFWDLIIFNIVKYVSMYLGSKTQFVKKIFPGIFRRSKEIAKMYHIYLLK